MLEEERVPESAALSGRASGRLANRYVRDEFALETIDLNVGPQHPAMHGLLRLILELDGETVVRCDPIMGYLHRSKEKISENRMYPAVIRITDRLDYFNNMAMEHGYCLAVEDLLDVEVPPRAEALRVMMAELSRLMSHIPSIGFLLLELGAFTPILYAFRERERAQNIMEAVTGARMMFHYIRIGGVKADLPEGIPELIWDFAEGLEERIQPDFIDLIEDNEIFISRTRGIGQLTQEKAIEMGLTGPPLRCTGISFDVRRDYPYSWYRDVDFDVVSDGSDTPYRVHYRTPCTVNLQLLQEIVPGHYLPDIMPIMGLVDPVSGAWDK